MRHLHGNLTESGLSRRNEQTCLNLIICSVKKTTTGHIVIYWLSLFHLKTRTAGLVFDKETKRLVRKTMDTEI